MLNRPPDYAGGSVGEAGAASSEGGRARGGVVRPAWCVKRGAASTEGVENEQVLSGTTEQAAEGLRRYQEWKDAAGGADRGGQRAAISDEGWRRACRGRRRRRGSRWRR